ncbi:MAG: ABC transporter ATP-binding protein, partial [Cyanobacteria bacterium J06629_2]
TFSKLADKSFFIMDKGAIVAKGKTPDLTDSLVHRYLTV